MVVFSGITRIVSSDNAEDALRQGLDAAKEHKLSLVSISVSTRGNAIEEATLILAGTYVLRRGKWKEVRG